MGCATGDRLFLAIVLRLHESPCTISTLAIDLAAPMDGISATLQRLIAAGIVARSPANAGDPETQQYVLASRAYRAIPLAASLPGAPSRPAREDLRPIAAVLRRAAFFEALQDTTLLEIARSVQHHAYQPGEILFLDGDECRGMYIVESGLVRIFKQGSDAGRELTVRLMGPGDTFNEVPVFDGGPNPVSAEVIEESRLLMLPAGAMRQIIQDYPEIARAAMTYAAIRVRHMLAMIHDLSMRQVRERVAKILLQSIEPDEGVGAGSDQRERLTQREIAEMAGTAREVVARTLKMLEREGAIAIRRGRITILDRAKLESIL